MQATGQSAKGVRYDTPFPRGLYWDVAGLLLLLHTGTLHLYLRAPLEPLRRAVIRAKIPAALRNFELIHSYIQAVIDRVRNVPRICEQRTLLLADPRRNT